MNHALIFENWRRFLAEEENEEPTVGEFLATWQKQNPKSVKKVLGKAAKWMTSLAVGVGAGAIAGAATGGLGAGVAGAAVTAMTAKKLDELFGAVADNASELAKFMIQMSENQVEDSQRTGLALYYDLDDEYEALLQGMDSDLANKYQEHLYAYFTEKFGDMKTEDDQTVPLKKYIEYTANDYLKLFLKDAGKSEVGVDVQVSSGE